LYWYLSKSAQFTDGFLGTPVRWQRGELAAGKDGDHNFGDYQSIQIVTQSDGNIFLIGLHNTSPTAPTIPGRDFVDLFAVTFPPSVLDAEPTLAKPAITKVGKRQMFCHDLQCNMDGAAGVHVTDAGQLVVYATYHWRSGGIIRLTEFREETPNTAPEVTDPRHGWIDLFEHRQFAGRRLSLLGGRGGRIPHYGKITVQGSTFENLVSSARWQLPRGTSYVLYRKRDFASPKLVLTGTGKVEAIPDLSRAPRGGGTTDFKDAVSSSRFG